MLRENNEIMMTTASAKSDKLLHLGLSESINFICKGITDMSGASVSLCVRVSLCVWDLEAAPLRCCTSDACVLRRSYVGAACPPPASCPSSYSRTEPNRERLPQSAVPPLDAVSPSLQIRPEAASHRAAVCTSHLQQQESFTWPVMQEGGVMFKHLIAQVL